MNLRGVFLADNLWLFLSKKVLSLFRKKITSLEIFINTFAAD